MKLLGDIATNHFLDPETPIPIKTIAFSSPHLEHSVRSHTITFSSPHLKHCKLPYYYYPSFFAPEAL